jgi:hypothetical protein
LKLSLRGNVVLLRIVNAAVGVKHMHSDFILLICFNPTNCTWHSYSSVTFSSCFVLRGLSSDSKRSALINWQSGDTVHRSFSATGKGEDVHLQAKCMPFRRSDLESEVEGGYINTKEKV